MASVILVFRIFTSFIIISSCVYGHLRPDFYSTSCPHLLSIVRCGIKKAIQREARLGASLLRLHFHDCFVNGCDGSILLDDSKTLRGEKTAKPNERSARGFEVIDDIKARVEATCSGVVSCADILTIAARDSVVELGGPTWTVPLGRRDSRKASFKGANKNLPGPTSNLSNLIQNFRNQGLNAHEMVVLSGAHTIGLSHCSSFKSHIYDDNDIDASFAKSLRGKCPSRTGSADNYLQPLDAGTPSCFDNKYYKNLVRRRGLFHSDQELFNGGFTNSQVITYSNHPQRFFSDFARAMLKMGNIKPLTGTKGEIRKNCRRSN